MFNFLGATCIQHRRMLFLWPNYQSSLLKESFVICNCHCPCRSSRSSRQRRSVTDPVLAISLPGYTTAELSATRDLTSTRPFVVGDNATYGRYHNVPLTPDTAYVVYYVVAVALDGVVKMAFSQLSSPVRTTVEDVTRDRTTGVRDEYWAERQNGAGTNSDSSTTTALLHFLRRWMR